MRKHGDQKRLDTSVVHAVNDEDSLLDYPFFFNKDDLSIKKDKESFSNLANALNLPPEEYDRKIKTQRNRRGPKQMVEHAV